MHVRMRAILVLLALFLSSFLSLSTPSSASSGTLTIGAVFPLTGMTSVLAHQELRGVRVAASLSNAMGGVDGRRIRLDVRSLEQTNGVQPLAAYFHSQHVSVVLGAYSSQLSIPLSSAVARRGMVYWEAGAVADRLTGRGLPNVFRIGASGSNLGTNSARFAHDQLAARLHKPASQLRVAVVAATDDYARSVGDAAVREAGRLRLHVVTRLSYNPYAYLWAPILKSLRQAHPDVLILASHIPDGVSFRRAMLSAHLHVGAFIGSTMAECGPNFGAELGSQAIGVFASDRPEGGFNPRALNRQGLSLYRRFQSVWKSQTGESQPTEEGLAGFSAAWALFHDVLPLAARGGSITSSGISSAATRLNIPSGSLPNGAGIHFASDKARLGQNQRAAAVVWQWQSVRHSVVVWPPVYATGKIEFVPLPR